MDRGRVRIFVPWPEVVWPASPRNEYGAADSLSQSPSLAGIASRSCDVRIIRIFISFTSRSSGFLRSARASLENVQAHNLHTAVGKLPQSGEPSLHVRRGVMTSKGAWLVKIS